MPKKVSMKEKAKAIKAFYEALQDEGFSETDTMELLKAYLKSGRS
jgi:hypothetical protein